VKIVKRKLKVYSQYQGNKAVPTIIIKGEWVKTANFKEGDYVELDVSDEKIVITKTTPPERKKTLQKKIDALDPKKKKEIEKLIDEM